MRRLRDRLAERRRAEAAHLPLLLMLPNLVTILGLCAGLTSMRFTMDGRFDFAAGLIVFAAVIDGLDGLLARRLNATSPFGAELDSLSDFLCFGVAPALLIYQFSLHDLGGAGWSAALVFAICCCLRLARFNVMRDMPSPTGRAHFLGVPAPGGALLALLPVFAALAPLADLSGLPVVLAVWVVAVGAAMVAPLRTFSPKSLRIPREWAAFAAIGVAILVGAMFTRFWLVMVVLDLGYIAVLATGGWAAWQRRQQRRRMGRQDGH